MSTLLPTLAAAGINTERLPSHLAIGKFYRLPAIGKARADKSCYVKMLAQGVAVFGNWSNSDKGTWFADKPTDKAELERWSKEAKAAQAKAYREQVKTWEEAAIKAMYIYDNATPASPHHPYLIRKGLEPAKLRQSGNALVIPVHSCIDGKIMSIQFIEPDGYKHFLGGGKTKGGFYATRHPKTGEMLVLSEGIATSLSMQQHWNISGCHYASFSAGNLVTLAKALRSRYPFNPMLICGDSDLSGTGQRKAQEAADATGCKVALPVFTEIEQQAGASDWLDRWQIDQRGAND